MYTISDSRNQTPPKEKNTHFSVLEFFGDICWIVCYFTDKFPIIIYWYNLNKQTHKILFGNCLTTEHEIVFVFSDYKNFVINPLNIYIRTVTINPQIQVN